MGEMCELSNSSKDIAEELFETSHISPSAVSCKITKAMQNLFLPKLAKNTFRTRIFIIGTPCT